MHYNTLKSKRIINVSLDEHIVKRLENLIPETGSDLNECIVQAVTDYIEEWEDFKNNVDVLGDEEDSPVFSMFNDF